MVYVNENSEYSHFNDNKGQTKGGLPMFLSRTAATWLHVLSL